jgi:hypothetical protein
MWDRLWAMLRYDVSRLPEKLDDTYLQSVHFLELEVHIRITVKKLQRIFMCEYRGSNPDLGL